STGIFTIMALTDETYSVKVLSLDGKVCYEETDVNISGKRMDLTNLPNGAYIVNIANDKAQVSKKIVIKK
ncbi:MAG: T9SS type A sorting domain-containing protein, partial [Bacteroidales bacterium]|nr:T9SS type A sorting domain-containing protein [Bacteroidales bacterium]